MHIEIGEAAEVLFVVGATVDSMFDGVGDCDGGEWWWRTWSWGGSEVGGSGGEGILRWVELS